MAVMRVCRISDIETLTLVINGLQHQIAIRLLTVLDWLFLSCREEEAVLLLVCDDPQPLSLLAR